jgi:hypothetical protein
MREVKITAIPVELPTGGFMQIRPKNSSGAPEWYAPNRDMLHQFPYWIKHGLERFDKMELSEEDQAALGTQCKALAGIINGICRGDYAKQQEKLHDELSKLQASDPEAFASIGGMVLTHMMYRFWHFAGEASMRKEDPI